MKCRHYCWRCQPSLNLHPYHSVVNEHALRKLLNMTNYGKLKYLSLNTCVYIDGDNFPPLENLSTLEHLDLANCDTLDDKLFVNSWNMPNLLSLNLRNTGVSSIGTKLHPQSFENTNFNFLLRSYGTQKIK
jgi:hypothetical protein